MEPRSTALGLLLLAALPLHGLLLPTGLGDFARAQEARRTGERELRRRPLPDGIAGSEPVECVAGQGILRFCWTHGVRFVATSDGSLTVARERSTEAITSAFDTDHGWVFLTRSGRALAADTFLGPMRVVAPPVCDHRAPRYGLGRAVQFVGDAAYAVDPDRGRVPLRAPARVDEVLFCDGLAGAAIDRDGALFRTTDAGAHWRPVSLRTSPARRDVALSLGCVGGPRVRLTRGWWRFDDDPRRDALVAADAPRPVEPRRDDAPRLARERFDELVTAAAPSCDDPAPEPPWDPPRATFFLRHRGATVRAPLLVGADVVAKRPPDGACSALAPSTDAPMTARLRWRGRDARGSFTGAADVFTVPHHEGMEEFSAEGANVLSVSRDGALLDTPLGDSRWVRGGRRTELAPFDAGLLTTRGTHLDNGRLLLVGLEREPEEMHPDQMGDSRRGRHTFVLALVDADGAMTSRAWSVHDAEAWIIGPAELAGRLGIAAVDRHHHGRFLPMDGDDAVALGPLPVERPPTTAEDDDDPPPYPPPQVRPCGATDATAPRLHFFSGVHDLYGESPPISLAPGAESEDRFRTSHAVYELRGGALCARTIDAFGDDFARDWTHASDEPTGAVRFEARDGLLEGTLDNGRVTSPVRLTATPPPANRDSWEDR
jgi:hypothetical protein